MAKVYKRKITASKKPAMTITRHGLNENKLVYVATANKRRRYPFGGRSAIVYIGTTKKGVDRIAQSAANKAKDILQDHGVKQLEFYVVTCRPLRRVQTWKKLERALILTFRETYGAIPIGNDHGKYFKWEDELRYFTSSRLKKVLDRLS